MFEPWYEQKKCAAKSPSNYNFTIFFTLLGGVFQGMFSKVSMLMDQHLNEDVGRQLMEDTPMDTKTDLIVEGAEEGVGGCFSGGGGCGASSSSFSFVLSGWLLVGGRGGGGGARAGGGGGGICIIFYLVCFVWGWGVGVMFMCVLCVCVFFWGGEVWRGAGMERGWR